jgi:hypothetical protein
MVPGGMLCVAEVVVAQFCACLVIYRPLFSRFISGASVVNTYNNVHSNSNYGGQVSTLITANKSRGPGRSGIEVTNDIRKSTHTYEGGNWVQVADERMA